MGNLFGLPMNIHDLNEFVGFFPVQVKIPKGVEKIDI
jgi:hypothetical protein